MSDSETTNATDTDIALSQSDMLAVYEALHGADKVKAQFEYLWNQHRHKIDPVLESANGRIKTFQATIDKIQTKRLKLKKETANGNPTPPYNIEHVEDLIGFRFNTLFRSDCLQVVDHLLRLITCQPGYENNLFQENALKELIFYKPNSKPHADDMPTLFTSLLKQHNCDPDAVLKTPEQKQSGYSSVHIVARLCRHVDNTPSFVTAEFQVRSNLENAWAQIEHRLSYKYKNEVEISEDNRQRAIEAARGLKEQIDGCDSQAEAIRKLLKFETGTFYTQESDFDPNSVDLKIFKEHKIHELFDSEWVTDVQRILEEFAQLHQQDTNKDIAEPESIDIEKLAELAEELQEAVNDPRLRHKTQLEYQDALEAVKMELALMYLMLGNASNGAQDFAKAGTIYASITGSMTEHPIYYYRLARVAAAQNIITDALANIQEAQNRLKDYFNTHTEPEIEWLLYDVPRFRSLILWEEAERYRHELRSKAPADREEIAGLINRYLEQALIQTIVSLTELDKLRKKHRGKPGKLPKHIDRSRIATLNNLLFFCMDLEKRPIPRHNGTPNDRGEQMFEGKSIKDWRDYAAKQLHVDRPKTIHNAQRAGFADTLRAYHDELDNAELAVAAARKVHELLDNKQGDRMPPDVVKEMKQESNSTLIKFGEKPR